MTLVYLMRHGETEWNGARRLQGQADIPLSETGRAQVRARRSALGARPVVAVASDLRRTVETAELMGCSAAETDTALREIDLGDWEGRYIDDLMEEDPAAYLNWRYGRFTPPGAECWPDFCDRTISALRRHAARSEAQTGELVVFCHGGAIRAVLDQLIGLPLDRIDPLPPAGLCVVRLTETAKLLSYNMKLR